MHKVLIIEFEDHGQDFLSWTVDLNTWQVVDSKPLMSKIWNGTQVVFPKHIIPGDYVEFISNHDGEKRTCKYPVEKVEIKELEVES